MHRNLLNSTVLLIFLFTQFVSMYSGLQMIASPSDFDNIDDISLEDVVPLDPFLSGNSVEIARTLPLLQGDAPVSLTLSDLHTPLDLPAPVETAFFERNQAVALMQDKGLWLANRVILS